MNRILKLKVETNWEMNCNYYEWQNLYCSPIFLQVHLQPLHIINALSVGVLLMKVASE